MYKSSRFVTKLKSEGAALLEEAEKKRPFFAIKVPASRPIIARCWVNANCLPFAMSAEIRSTYGRMRNSSKDDEVRNVMEMLANLRLNLGEDDSLRNSVDDKVTASDVEQWFDVENDDDVRDAVVADFDDEMEKITIKTPV